ncbi:MAG: YoaP domain-containing protein [Cytophagales bacterium]|nr:YoaP domain-containing protein [Cytophagales bacterium]
MDVSYCISKGIGFLRVPRNKDTDTAKQRYVRRGTKVRTPATIFSLFYNGKFVTTDISVCMDSRFDKIVDKELKWQSAKA